MTKTFCDVCGKPGGVLELEVAKMANEFRIVLSVNVTIGPTNKAHICDPCVADLLQDARSVLHARIATVVHQAEPPL